ncbi:MAG: hypothetical protein ACRC5M_02465 [Anaeroplasmataceae bacterium]
MYEDIINNYKRESQDLKAFTVNFCYNSGKIENEEFDYNDTRDIFEIGRVTKFTGKVITLIEQLNQKRCIKFIIEESKLDSIITIDLLKRLHLMLMEGAMSDDLVAKGEMAGTFKKGDFAVGISDVGAHPDDVEKRTEIFTRGS